MRRHLVRAWLRCVVAARAVGAWHALRRRTDLRAALDLATPHADGMWSSLDASAIAATVERSLRRPRLMRKRHCLRVGVVGYRCLAEAGLGPKLHFAVEPSDGPGTMAAHCWVTIDGEPVISGPSPGMVTMLTFDHRTRRDAPSTGTGGAPR